jgi:predicted DNA-binding WGR domain protein
MAVKLGRSTYPDGTSASDLECYGPPATTDTDFRGTKLADMGCFQQEGVDSNKYYFCCVCKNKKDGKWYLYVEYGRVGASNPQFQFTECHSESDAQTAYEKQCAEKNTKRGEWQTIGGMRLFRPVMKKGKPEDLYVVRDLARRDYGPPSCRDICSPNHVQTAVKTKSTSKTKSYRCDAESTKLFRDLLGGTIAYTRSVIQGNTVPTKKALEEGTKMLEAAKRRLVVVGSDVMDQVADKDLKQITYALYGSIPKIKPIGASEDTWILSANNILQWEQDIQAFESALSAGTVEDVVHDDPLATVPADLEWINPTSELGSYLTNWWTKASRNRHSYLGNLKIHHIWKVDRHGELAGLKKRQQEILKEMPVKWNEERPLHQDKKRFDLNTEERKEYWNSNTALLFHGTRSCNTASIITTGFRFPKELTGVAIAGAMFTGGGGGIYQADDHKKSAGYTSLSNSIWSSGGGAVKGRHAFMFACDIICGVPHVAPGPHPYVAYPRGTHCIFGKAGHSQVQNNEWIILHKPQQALRYLAEISY